MSLSDIILDKITNNRLSITLNNDEIIYLQTLLANNPEVFNKISENIKKIAADNKLDLHDIPQIILLISNLFNTNLIKHILVNIDIINIIQFTIDILLESGLLSFPELELTIINYVIISSLTLLRMNIKYNKKKKHCFSFIFKCF
jgi:hypothetical protein